MLGMFKDPKKMATLIIAGMGKDGESKSYDREIGNAEKSEGDFDSIANDILNAIESKNSKDLSMCLKSFFNNIESRLSLPKEEESEEME